MTADDEWVAGLLHALPPAQMPPEQRELLDALIAKEAARSAEQEPSLPAQPTATAVPTQRGQRRRRALLGLATAAAALTMFAVVDPLATTGLEDSGTAALAPQDSQASLGTGLTLSPGTPAMLSSGTQYTHAELAHQAQAVAAGAAADKSAGPPLSRPIRSPRAWTSIPEVTGPIAFVDQAQFEQRPALVVAVVAGTELQVVVVADPCTQPEPEVLDRVTVDAPQSDGE